MLINNVPITESLYQTLSESEIKRFALVVLHAMIHYGKYDYIILDDPIDSYDDYYLLIACSYIKEILEEKKLLGWYIFTNNYDALRILSSILKCDSITFYDDPDCIFSSLPMQTLSFVSTYKEVQSASQNEVVTLFDYVKTNKAEIDPELGFITFIITLRNMNATIFNTFENVNVTSKTKKAITKNTLFATQLKSYVEHYYMHYDPNPDVNGINSHSNNIDTIYQIYNMITRFKNSITSNLSGNLGPIEKMRESLAKKPFLTLSGSKLINLICKKITIISFLKYEFEKLLITKLGTSFRFVQSDIDTIVTTKCLGHKLNKAKAINIGSGYCAKRFLDKYDKIFDKYSVLINSFDHAFELMFPPYIMTSIKDIKKFNEDIEELGREF